MQTTSEVKLDSVVYNILDGYYAVTIYLNETKIIEDEKEMYQYDFHTFKEKVDILDIQNVINNPEKYFTYEEKHVTAEEQLRADVDYLLLLNE